MATIFDLIEVTDITANTTYSDLNGNLLGVVDGAVSGEFDDGEFDEGDVFTLDGQTYTVDLIQEPSSSGRFTLGDGTEVAFNPQSEDDLDVIFLTVSSGADTRHFIIPSDRYGDLNFQSIRTGNLTDVGGNDAALVSTTNNEINAVCFAAGTMIRAGDGSDLRVEDVTPGLEVQTLDNGPQPVKWIGRRDLSVPTMLRYPKLRPIRIPAGALAADVPASDLSVSPQHRLLVRSRIAERMFGSDDVLVAARHLVGVNGIEVDQSAWTVTYVHLLLDTHELLFANGAPSESLYLGPQSRKVLGDDTLDEIALIFGSSVPAGAPGQSARPLISGRRARRMSARHVRNSQALFQPA